MRAAHQTLHAIKDRVLRSRRRAASLVLKFLREKSAQCIPRLVIFGGDVREPRHVLDFVFTAHAYRAVLRAQPASPIARLEFLELVALGTRIEQDEIRNRIVEMTKLLRE